MKIALIGMQKSGKTTIFNALAGAKAGVAEYVSDRSEPNLAVIAVGDPRVRRLAELYRPRKTTYAAMELVDFAGVAEGAPKGGTVSADLMRLVRNADALAVVLRNFPSAFDQDSDPLGELKRLEEELLLADLIVAEKRLETIQLGYRRGQKSAALQAEEKLMQQVVDHLNAMQSLRTLTFDDGQQKMVRGFQFLTLKPLMAIVNSDESNFGANRELLSRLEEQYPAIEFAGNFEMELSRLDAEEDRQLFMESIGIDESATDRLTRCAYQTLGYITFFTVGEDEVRAWDIRRGATAQEAAARIHTDLARGFIRAECFTCDQLVQCGSEKVVREKGYFRLEGKTYLVKDGDILSIRFNV